jgi:8-oxo-dGTP pyrophosphatase MutT (NUDIX family)
MEMVTLAGLRRRLSRDEPPAGELRRASVAVIIDRHTPPKVLLIERARVTGDPWSGQVAFPGGKAQTGDLTLKDTAVREAMEEVGIDLAHDAEFLGYHQGLRTHNGLLDVFPAAFSLERDVKTRPNEEVASFMWASLDVLASASSRGTANVRDGGQAREVPALRVGEYAVWGLTYRILSSLLG